MIMRSVENRVDGGNSRHADDPQLKMKCNVQTAHEKQNHLCLWGGTFCYIQYMKHLVHGKVLLRLYSENESQLQRWSKCVPLIILTFLICSSNIMYSMCKGLGIVFIS